MSSRQSNNALKLTLVGKPLSDKGSTIKEEKDSLSINQPHESLSFRQYTPTEILEAAYTVLRETIGSSPTVTIGDIYSQLLGVRGSRAWESEHSRKSLTPHKIGQTLTHAGFVNIMSPRRTARYQPPQYLLDVVREPCQDCIHNDTCLLEPGSTDSGICGSFETEVRV